MIAVTRFQERIQVNPEWIADDVIGGRWELGVRKVMEKVWLKYLGGGSLHGVPARDLTKAEAENYGGSTYLMATGLYAAVETEAPKKGKEVKADDRRA